MPNLLRTIPEEPLIRDTRGLIARISPAYDIHGHPIVNLRTFPEKLLMECSAIMIAMVIILSYSFSRFSWEFISVSVSLTIISKADLSRWSKLIRYWFIICYETSRAITAHFQCCGVISVNPGLYYMRAYALAAGANVYACVCLCLATA